jgi:hypothetical protein
MVARGPFTTWKLGKFGSVVLKFMIDIKVRNLLLYGNGLKGLS